MIKFTVNGEAQQVEADGNMPLLWYLRDFADLRGTKYGCGGGFCGACTVHLDGEAVRSCSTPLVAAEGRAVTTIEGLSEAGDHPVQEAWTRHQVPQCGYCQPGQIMQAAALLAKNPSPDSGAIDEAMKGNLCRCGTYPRIKAALLDLAEPAS